MLKDPLAFEDIDIRRRDRLATERVTEVLKKRRTSCGQRFDCSVYASACANGSRQGVHLNTYICNINKNQQKVINGKSAVLSTDCALRYARTMSYADGNGLTRGHLRRSWANQWRQNTQATRLAGLHSAPKRYEPSRQLPTKGARKDICALAAARSIPGPGIVPLVRGELTRPWTVASSEIANLAGDVMIRPQERSPSLIRR